MKNLENIKVIFKYFKEDRIKLIFYILLTFMTFIGNFFCNLLFAISVEKITQNNFDAFWKMLLISILLKIAIMVFLTTIVVFLENKLRRDFMEKINKNLYKKIMNMPAEAFEDYSVGEFINRIYRDPDVILMVMENIIRRISQVIEILIIIILVFTASKFVGVELILFGILIYLVTKIFYPKIEKIEREMKGAQDEYVKNLNQNVTGIREIKALGIKDNIIKKSTKLIKTLFSKEEKIENTEILFDSISQLCSLIMEAILFYSLGFGVFNGKFGLTIFLMVQTYIIKINNLIKSLGQFGILTTRMNVAFERIDEIMNSKIYHDEEFGNIELKNENCVIEFKNVKFKYREKDEKNILNGLNLKIEPFKKVAIVGKSGHGKTTIFNLLLRYFDCIEGEININGINIKELTEESLRNNIAIIRQNPYIFNTTLFENFKMIKEDITLEEIRKVCKAAYIDEYIMSLPDKYNTVIGEGGVNLSGGQKQRIAIARVLLKNSKIILFDEATSALDNESQEYIKKTIDKLCENHTVIIVAHRFSTIMDADEIYLINEGKVENMGTHEELINKSEIYKKLYLAENNI